MIYLYYGADSFRAHETIQQLEAKFRQKFDKAGHNLVSIGPDAITLEDIVTASQASGFLSLKKFIVVRNPFEVKQFAEFQEGLIAYLKQLRNDTDENYLIFWQDGSPKHSKLFTFLKDTCDPKCIQEYAPLPEGELVKWIQQRSKRSGKTLSKDAAELFISLVGTDAWRLDSELQKVVHFSTAQAITAKDLQSVVSIQAADVIFPLMDAIGSRSITQALSLLDKTLASADPGYVLAMLIRQFRLIMRTKELSGTTKNAYAVSNALKVPGFVANKLIHQATRFDRHELATIFGKLIELDTIHKSDPERLGTALILFVANLAPTSSNSRP